MIDLNFRLFFPCCLKEFWTSLERKVLSQECTSHGYRRKIDVQHDAAGWIGVFNSQLAPGFLNSSCLVWKWKVLETPLSCDKIQYHRPFVMWPQPTHIVRVRFQLGEAELQDFRFEQWWSGRKEGCILQEWDYIAKGSLTLTLLETCADGFRGLDVSFPEATIDSGRGGTSSASGGWALSGYAAPGPVFKSMSREVCVHQILSLRSLNGWQ